MAAGRTGEASGGILKVYLVEAISAGFAARERDDMTEQGDDRCFHCGQRMPDAAAGSNPRAEANLPANASDEPLEHDHRGLPLPRRTRNGGIITPQ
jgi:hypothetical protein